MSDKLRVTRNKGPGITVTKAQAVIRGSLINHNFGEGGAGRIQASIAYATIVLNTARFAAGVAANNTVTVLASLLSGNLGSSMAGECGGSGRLESKGWNLTPSRPARSLRRRLERDVGAFERQPDDVML